MTRIFLTPFFILGLLLLPAAACPQHPQPKQSVTPSAPQSRNITLDEFRERFAKIKNLDWVPSQRKGSTGIGFTLETLLGIAENNIALPDLGAAELKSHRLNSSSMVTLFTFDKDAWKINPLAAVRKYGTRDDNGRLNLFFTMAPTPNGMGLYLQIDAEAISVRHVAGEVLAEWPLQALAERFLKKMPALMFVSALSEYRGETEHFKYSSARLLSGSSPEILREQLRKGNVLVDLRIHDGPTSARNRGTAFRVRAANLPLLFSSIREL